MAKKSQRRPMQREKNQASCMWGLIKILDFRSSRKLLTDPRRQNRLVAGDANLSNKLELLKSCNEDLKGILDCKERTEMIGEAEKTTVKTLIEKEMVTEDVKTGVSKTGTEHERSSLVQESQRNHKRSKRSSKKSCDLDGDNFGPTEGSELECSCDQNMCQLLAANHNENEIVEDLCQWIIQKSSGCKKCDCYGQVGVQLNPEHSDVKEKLFKLINEFLNKQLTSVKHLKDCGNFQCSTDVKMLQFLTSADFSLLDLPQDPNKAVMQYVQSLQDSHLESLEEFNLSEEEGALMQYEDSPHHEQFDKFRRRANSHEEKSLNRNEKSPVSNRIVILKPGMTDPLQLERGCNPCSSPQILYTAKRQSTRASAHYFISDMKRKLKNMVAKEHPGSSVRGSKKQHRERQQILESVGENGGKCSASKDDLYVELAGIKREKSKDKPGDIQAITKSEAADDHEHRLSIIYAEAKKHLFEMFNHGDADAVFFSRQYPETLGRILSNPELNCFPTVSTQRDSEHGIRNHPHSSTQETTESSISKSFTRSVQTLETDLNISEVVISSDELETTDAVSREEMISEDICGAPRMVIQGDCDICGPPSEPVKSLSISVESTSEDECSKPKEKKSYGMEQQPLSLFSSPPSALTIEKVEDLELVIDRSDRPSPVSVLDPLFTEDDISPAPVELSTQSLQVEFEDDFSTTDEEIYLRNFEEEKELVSEYIKEVLEASNLDCDDLYMKSQSSDQLIELSVLDKVDFFDDHLHYDHKLLFDCINEVLLEVFDCYDSCYPCLSFVKRRTRPVPNMKYAILEVCRGVHWHLLPLPLPRSLEQIVQKDMSKTGTWMDLRFDVENVGIEMSEAIVAELMDEVMSSCVNERVRRVNALQSVSLGHIKMDA